MCVRYVWQGDHQIYGHIRCAYRYTVLANPKKNVLKKYTPYSIAPQLSQGHEIELKGHL